MDVTAGLALVRSTAVTRASSDARARRIDALAPDRSRLSALPREMSPEMRRAEQRIERRPLTEKSRATVLSQLLAKSARDAKSILWGL